MNSPLRWFRHPLLAIAFLAGTLVIAASGQILAETVPLNGDPMMSLPADERHEFKPVDPSWIKVTVYLQHGPAAELPGIGGYDQIPEDELDPNYTAYDRMENYYAKTEAKSDYRKSLWFDSDGHLMTEIDRGNGMWSRKFFADGTVSSYNYNGWQAGFSVRPDRKVVSVYSGGTGEFIFWDESRLNESGFRFSRRLFNDGQLFMYEAFEFGLCTYLQISLDVSHYLPDQRPGYIFSIDRQGEHFNMLDRLEEWDKTSTGINVNAIDGAPSVEPDEIHKSISTPPPPRPSRGLRGMDPAEMQHWNELMAERQAALDKAYSLRRAVAMEQVDALLKKVGKTWEELGLTGIKNGITNDLPAPDPAWLMPLKNLSTSPTENSAQLSARILGTKIGEVKMDNLPLGQLLSAFTDRASVDLDVDWLGLEAANIPKKTKVSLNLSDPTLGEALDALIKNLHPDKPRQFRPTEKRSYQIAYSVRNGAIAVIVLQISSTLNVYPATAPARGLPWADDLYVTTFDGTILKIENSGNISIFATGLNEPNSVAFDANGNLFVANAEIGTISKVTKDGVVGTFVAGLKAAMGLAFDSQGDLYVGNPNNDTIMKVSKSGIVTTFAIGFNNPHALAFDSQGELFVGNFGGNRGTHDDGTTGTIMRVTKDGKVSTFATGFGSVSALAFDAHGDLFVAGQDATIFRVTSTGAVSVFAKGIAAVNGVAFDSQGDLIVASLEGGKIFRVTKDGVAGFSVVGLNNPYGLAFNHQVLESPPPITVSKPLPANQP